MSVALPTLSQVSSHTTEHLRTTATYLRQVAEQREQAFVAIRNETHQMGWEGLASEAWTAVSHRDMQVVADHVHHATTTARLAENHADDLDSLRKRLLQKVESIKSEDFRVTEAFQVLPPRSGGGGDPFASLGTFVKYEEAVKYTAELQAQVAQFMAAEAEAGANMTRAAEQVGEVRFTGAHPNPRYGLNTGNNNGHVQAVDHHKTDPPPFAPWDTPNTGTTPGTVPFNPGALIGGSSPQAAGPPTPRFSPAPPASPPPPVDHRPPTGPGSAVCDQKLQQQADELPRSMEGGAAIGAIVGGFGSAFGGNPPTPEELLKNGDKAPAGAAVGAFGGALAGAFKDFISDHPRPPECGPPANVLGK